MTLLHAWMRLSQVHNRLLENIFLILVEAKSELWSFAMTKRTSLSEFTYAYYITVIYIRLKTDEIFTCYYENLELYHNSAEYKI